MSFHIKYILCIVFVCVIAIFLQPASSTYRGPRLRIFTRQAKPDTLMLPSNATSIRENITDTFSCENRTYGYYADVDNDCQIFHVCLPVTYSDGRNRTFKWSFICPEETIFNQEVFVCTREEDSINCEDSPDYYVLNENFGGREEEENTESADANEGSDNNDSNPENTAESESIKAIDTNSIENKVQDDRRRRKPANQTQKRIRNNNNKTKKEF